MNKKTENRAKSIVKRMEELEKKARYNKDKWDDISLIEWLDEDEKEEYESLREEYNKL